VIGILVGQLKGMRPLKGEIADLRIWDVEGGTINDQNIANNSPDLVYYLKFDEGIANGNNQSPALINMVTNEVVGSPVPQVELFNFDLTGDDSNWRGCDNYALVGSPITVSINNDSRPPGGLSPIIPYGGTIRIESTITGTDGLESYQWLKDGKAIEGATSATFIKEAELDDYGRYQLRVDNFNTCPIYSNPVEITVKGLGSVMNFDGVDDYVEVVDINESTVFTMETWVKFESNPNGQVIVSGTSEFGPLVDNSHQFFIDNNGFLTFSIYDQTGLVHNVIKSDQAFVQDRWYHIAGRVVGFSTMELFVDGALQSQITNPGSVWMGIDRFNIGGFAKDGDQNILSAFKGEIDEFRYWDVYRSNSELLEFKDKEIRFEFPDPDTYLQFNQGIPDGDNTNFNPFSLPNIIAQDEFEAGRVVLYNFDFEGPISNFSNCSPVVSPTPSPYTIPNVDNVLNIPQSYIFGHDVRLLSGIFGDTSNVSFQWLKDGQGISNANNGSLVLENVMPSDTGRYALRVEDTCDPPYIDTATVIGFNFTCFSDLTTFPIDPTVMDTISDCYSRFNICGLGDTLNLENKIFGGYCGLDVTYGDPEKIYEITFTEPRVLFAKLTGLTEPLDFFLFGDDCDINNCLASSTHPGLQDDSLQVGLNPGTYYLVLDGTSEFGGEVALNYTLIFNQFDSKCEESVPLACGTSVSDDTGLGSNFSSTYCGQMGYEGTEKIYQVTLSNPKTLSINLTSTTEDLDVFLLDSTCFENGCLASSTNGLGLDDNILFGANAGTYYIVVDGKNGVTGAFNLSLDCADYFSASFDDNDAYIDLTWSIDKNLCVPQDTGIIIKLITPPNTILYEETFNTAALTPDIISGTYRHYVGVDHTQLYALRVSNRLSNATLCNEIDTGRTTPFAAPEFVSISNATYPDSIRLVWRNHSKLSDQFRVFREGTQIINLIDGYTEDSLLVTYVDAHDINDTTSIQAASAYNYCIETYSSQLLQTYPTVCANGSTFDVNFQASYGSPTDQVQLTWNDVSSFCTGIQIKRNGIIETILSPNQTFYNDMEPIFGIESTYTLELLQDNVVKMDFEATGFVPPNGKIEGRVISENGSYPIADVQIVLLEEKLINGQLVLDTLQSTTTNFTGNFTFNDIVYGLSQSFTINATRQEAILRKMIW
jgi:hypothetical protein